MLTIPKNLTINRIEELHIELNQRNTGCDLQLPFALEKPEFNSIPMLIQLVATWIRSGKSGKISVLLPNLDENTLKEFIKQDYNYTICILAWRCGIYSDTEQVDIRPQLRTYNPEINLKMKSLKGLTGNQVMLSCFDHINPENGLLNCFYDGTSFVTAEAFLEFTLLPAMTDVLKLNREMLKNKFVPIQQDMIAIIYELMKNTHEWARTDRDHKPINPNVRGLFTKLVRRNKTTLLQENQNQQLYQGYFNSLTTNTNNEVYFLEIDVFDTGAGFIEKWPENIQNPTPKDRFDIVRKCLIKNHTAATGIMAEGKGRGLDRILNILDDKGLLFIRTDRISVYRNLKKNRYIPTSNITDVELFDARTHSSRDITEMPYASGAAISIIYPIS